MVRISGTTRRIAAALVLGALLMAAGPLANPAAAVPLQTPTHGLGGNLTAGLPQGISAAAANLAQATTLPDSVDLSEWDPPVGDQGQVGSCVSWATGYYYRYWLRNHAFGETSTFAPMYLYSQIAQGKVNRGSSFRENFNIMESQGIDHEADYPQGDYDYTTQPTPDEVMTAATYKITSYANLFVGPNSGDQTAVEASLAAGKPVDLMIPVYPNFDAASATDPVVGVPSPGTTSRGNHGVFAAKYDASGVWIENSWGTRWGLGGWAELSWAFVNQYAKEGWNMTADTWSVTLGASATNVTPGTSVTLTAVANQDVGPMSYYLVILRGDGSVVQSCGSGTVCAATVTNSAAQAWVYHAVVGETTGASPQVTSGQVTVVWAPAATHFTVSAIPSPSVAGAAQTVGVVARDADNNVVTGYHGTVHFTSSDPKAVLPADYTFTAADAGAHTFSYALSPGLTLRTAGTQSVTATDTVTSSINGTQTGIVVTPAAVKTLVVSGLSSPRTAGSWGSIRVTAVDAYGNRVHSYLGTVHFTSTDAKAKLPANYTFTAADAGTHVFVGTVILKTVGTQSVTANDTLTASIKGSQSGIVVTAAALSKLVVSGLTTPRTAGSWGSIRVTATDAYGNRVHSYLGTVHFTSSDTKAKLPANYTFTAADAGTHVFSGTVILKTVGTQSVTANDTLTASIKGTQTGIVVKSRAGLGAAAAGIAA